MATNNNINVSASGIVYYNGSGTFTGLANPLTVANAGTSVSSNTAYAVLCGGTTPSGAIQSIASVGTSGQFLVSNGAVALPTFQSISNKGYTLSINSSGAASPADSSTYFIFEGRPLTFSTSSAGQSTRLFVPKSGTLTHASGFISVNTVLGTTENVTIYARLNDTTDITLTSTSQWSAVAVTFSNTGLSTAVSAGDFLQIKIVTPAWSTNPTGVRATFSLLIE